MDRKKDMIISGGFNIYPSDLEAEIVKHEAVQEAAVVGVPSRAWGETPVAFVALKPGHAVGAEELKAWLNGKVGKTQRLADLQIVDALPRSHIGKVLKRELRDDYRGVAADGLRLVFRNVAFPIPGSGGEIMMEGNQAQAFEERQRGTLPGELGVTWDVVANGEGGGPLPPCGGCTWPPTASCTPPRWSPWSTAPAATAAWPASPTARAASPPSS